MVVDQKLLNSQMMKYNIWSNVINKISGQQAQTPTQQTTPIVQQPVQQTTPTQIINKTPVYDIKSMMWFSPQATKNQITNINQFAQQQQANKPQANIQTFEPVTNNEWLTVHKTASFKDLVADLQNVANQWRNLEFVKFRDLYPEYIENWDKVVDLFESIKANPNYTTEQVTRTAQKTYPELFGNTDTRFSAYDKEVWLKKLYDEMVNNQKSWQAKLTRQDIINDYPEFANTQDISTIEEIQDMIYDYKNLPTKKMPTYVDIAENFGDLFEWNEWVGITMFNDLDKLNNLSETQLKAMSKEWQDYIETLINLKSMVDAVRKNYKVDEDVTDQDIINAIKEVKPELYNNAVKWTMINSDDRKIWEEKTTNDSAIEKLWKSIAIWAWEFGTQTLQFLGDISMKLLENKANKMTLGLAKDKVHDTAQQARDLINKGTDWLDTQLEESKWYNEVSLADDKRFWDALKQWDWWTMATKSWKAIWTSLPSIILAAATGWWWAVAWLSFLPSASQRALEDIENDPNLSKLSEDQKYWLALLQWGVESTIEWLSFEVVFPWLAGRTTSLLDRIWWQWFKKAMSNALVKWVTQTELWALSEWWEEVLQEFFSNLIAKGAWSDRDMGTAKEYWDIFTETFLSSQLLSAMWWAGEWYRQNQTNKANMQELEKVKWKILEWQVNTFDNYEDYNKAMKDVFPKVSDKELANTWNKMEQKKYDLAIRNGQFYDKKTVELPTEQLSESDNIEYNNILDEMLNNWEITDEQRERVAKQLWITTLNNKSSEQQQWQMQSESLKSTWLSDLTNKTEDNNTNNKKKVKAGVWTRMLQNYNRMNPKRIRKFEAQFKETYWQWMEERWFTKAWESNVNDIIDYSKQMQKLKTQIIDKIAWEYRDIAVSDMLSYATERASDTLDRENLKRLQPLLDKYESWKWLTFQEIEKMRKYFSNNINLPYYEDTDAKTAEKNMNVYTALQKYVENIADENGFDKLKEINAEISASESIARWVIEKILWADSNNPLWLTDRITIAGAVSAWSPWAIATVLVKNALKNENVRNAILRVAVWKRDNAKYRWVKIDLDNISKIADEKKRNQAFDEFMKKWKIDSEKLQNTLALPQYEPIAEIWENWPKIKKPNTPQPTVKKDIVEINKPQIEKPKPQWLSQLSEKLGVSESKAEEVQESIDDFLNFVWANETKPTLDNATTADYSQMSTRWLETLLESDKIPIDEAKKINDELEMRKVKEDNANDSDSWDYLDHKYAYQIQKLQEEEQRIGKVGNRKVNKEYAEKQRQAWIEKREALIKSMDQAYNKDTNRSNEKYRELEWKSLSFINEWTRSKRFAVDEAEQEVITNLQNNWNKINKFELMLTAEEQEERAKILDAMKENGYEIRTTEAWDSFYDTKNRDNKWAINRWQQVNATTFEALKNSGLYDMLPDDTKIYISWQEIQTLWELKNTKPENNWLAEMNIDKEAEAQVEWLAKINEQIAKEEQEKIDIEKAEVQELEEQAKAQEIIDNEIADEQNDIDKQTDQKTLNDMEFTEQELNNMQKWFEETEKQGLAAISVKVEDGKIIKESKTENTFTPTKTINDVNKFSDFGDILEHKRIFDNWEIQYIWQIDWKTVEVKSDTLEWETRYSVWIYPWFEQIPWTEFYRTKGIAEDMMSSTDLENIKKFITWEDKFNRNEVVLVDEEWENTKNNNPSNSVKTVEVPEWEFEILPDDVKAYDEAKIAWPKRISPDRWWWWQQLTPQAAIDKYIEIQRKKWDTRIKQYNAITDILDWFIAKFWDKLEPTNRSAEATEARKTIRREVLSPYNLWNYYTAWNLKWLKDLFEWWKKMSDYSTISDKAMESIKKDYIKHIKEDISHWYRYPEAVLSYNPEFRKAVDSRARYEKWLYTSFSTEDTRIDYSQKDVLWAWMKRQDGKEITQAQKDEIVKWVMEFQEYMWVDMKQLAEDNNRVYVHLNGKNPFLMWSKMSIAWLYRWTVDSKWRSTASISLWWVEWFKMRKDWKVVLVKEKPVASHEIAHAIDYLNNGRLLEYDDAFYKLRSSYNSKWNMPMWSDEYWNRKTEITARMIEQYIAIEKWDYSYYTSKWYRNEDIYNSVIVPEIEKIKNKYFSKYKTRVWEKSIDEIKTDAIIRWLAEISKF